MENFSVCLDYLVEKLGIDRCKLDDLCNLLYKNYGTTMAGLRVCTLKVQSFTFAHGN